MKLTRLIDFRNQNSGWREIEHRVGNYFIENDGEHIFRFVDLEKAIELRKVIDVYDYHWPANKAIGRDFIFFEKFLIVQFWDDEEHCQELRFCSIGLENQRWLLSEDEEIKYQNFNPQEKIPPPAVVVAVYDNIRNRFTKKIIVSRNGGQIL